MWATESHQSTGCPPPWTVLALTSRCFQRSAAAPAHTIEQTTHWQHIAVCLKFVASGLGGFSLCVSKFETPWYDLNSLWFSASNIFDKTSVLWGALFFAFSYAQPAGCNYSKHCLLNMASLCLVLLLSVLLFSSFAFSLLGFPTSFSWLTGVYREYQVRNEGTTATIHLGHFWEAKLLWFFLFCFD